MAGGSPILALLSADGEPSHGAYRDCHKQIISKPEIISNLIDEDRDSALFSGIMRHSHRVVRLLDQIFSRGHQLPKAFPLKAIATATIAFFKYLIPILHDAAQLVSILLPALRPCFASGVPQVRELVSALVRCENVMECLINDHEGASALIQWTQSPSYRSQDGATLEAWTNKLVQMIRTCAADHHVGRDVARWDLLKSLKCSLQELRDEHESSRASRATHPELPVLANMKQLTEDLKRSLDIRSQGSRDVSGGSSFKIDGRVSDLLNQFQLPVPASSWKLEETIEELEGGRTGAILQALITSFPCPLCQVICQAGVDTSQSSTATAGIDHTNLPLEMDMDLFGQSVGHWEVLLSTPTFSTLQRLGRLNLSGPVYEKLVDMARGKFLKVQRAGSQKARRHLEVPVFRTKCGQNLFIVWQIHVDVTRKSNSLSQVVKIWAIVDNDQINKFIEYIGRIQSTWSTETISRSRTWKPPGDEVIDPVAFDHDTSSAESNSRSHTGMDLHSTDSDCLGLVEKFYVFTEPLLHSQIMNDLSPTLPYQLSRHEMEIIRHCNSPTIILGRSGTGKTTCLIFRLVGKYLASKSMVGGGPIRQVLLTRSPILAKNLRIYIRKLIRTLLTRSTEQESAEADAEVFDARSATVLSMNDSRFPYVCTFEEFLQLLENTSLTMSQQTPGERRASQVEHSHGNIDRAKDVADLGCCVNFETFKVEYWPLMPRNITKHLPVSLAFAEIMGTIKRSATSVTSLASLTREEYYQRSDRIAPTLTLEHERKRAYQAFEIYEKLKCERHQVDYVDRVVSLLRTIRTNPALKRLLTGVFDELYIDEVQDQRSIDIVLFLSLVKDSRGFHVAGDSAQAISHESTFRFADVKALIHDHFTTIRKATSQNELARPIMFTLGLNYRSQHRIVELASFFMSLLWKAFPETIDKLDPEMGQLNGPMPILFTGCERNVLARSRIDSSNLPASTASFGSEQVVLVRDDRAKNQIRKDIGDVALTLTILQSKGMEFNGVILFDFFSTCPDAGGLRRLPAIVGDDPRQFDPKTHVAMCTELKNLYVVVTRARKKLFIMETSGANEMSPIVQMLTKSVPTPIVEVIRHDDASYDRQIQLLQSDEPADPIRWSERGWELMERQDYGDALHCFKQAADQGGLLLANAHNKRAQGRHCLIAGDIEGAAHAMEAAAALFIQAGYPGDAVNVYRTMKWYQRAAGKLDPLEIASKLSISAKSNSEVWVGHGEHEKAAPFFADARIFTEAADCYDRAGQYSEAAAVLWQGKEYDALVQYVVKNRANFPDETLGRYCSMCKFLLAQNKLGKHCQKEAISLLGSPQQRERFLRQYGMYDALDELYLQERRIDNAFELRLSTGNLDKSLQLLYTKETAQQLVGRDEEQMNLLMDYVVMGRVVENVKLGKTISAYLLKGLSKFSMPAHQHRLEQWKASLGRPSNRSQNYIPALQNVDNGRMKMLIAVQILSAEPIAKATTLEALMTDALREAVSAIKDILLGDDVHCVPSILATYGIWKLDRSSERFVILPWSPLSNGDAPSSLGEIESLARGWIARLFANSITALHDAANRMWKRTWPTRCAQFMVKQWCPRHPDCPYKHEFPTSDAYKARLKQLLWMNRVFCGLIPLFYRRVMDQGFQKKFLPTRRAWLERLLSEITWVSAFEQDDAVLNEVLFRIRSDGELSLVASEIEALLFHRLKHEWQRRKEYSQLLEQMQLATKLDVRGPLFRALFYKVRSEDQGSLMWKHLDVVNKMESDVKHPDATAFRHNVETFVLRLNQLETDGETGGFFSFHSLMGTFEYLATYAILKICPSGFVIPRSWLSLHLRCIGSAVGSSQLPTPSNSLEYQESLIKLLEGFCGLMTWLKETMPPNTSYYIGNRAYHNSLLQPRYNELLVVSLINVKLGGLTSDTTTALFQAVSLASQILHYNDQQFQIYAMPRGPLHYRGDLPDFCKQLARTFEVYGGKNALLFVQTASTLPADVQRFQQAAGVRTLTIEEAIAYARLPRTQTTSVQSFDINSTSTEQFSSSEIHNVMKLQLWWREKLSLLRGRRLGTRKEESQYVARIQRLTAGCILPSRIHLRGLLLERGRFIMTELSEVQGKSTSLHKSVLAAVANATDSEMYEKLDQLLSRANIIEESLRTAADAVTDDNLQPVIDKGLLLEMQSHLEGVQAVIEQANAELLEIQSGLKE
ncbi:MAG: hypothetical protein Q9179_005365, partial [Wetmoreana sp. 5 TL-2023]